MPKPPQKSSKSIRQASRPLARPAKPARSASSPYQSRAGQAYRDQPAPYRREEAEPEAAAPKPRKPAPLRAYPARFKSPDDSSPKVSPKPSPKPSSKPSPKPSFARPPAAQPAARPNTARQAAPANQTSRPASAAPSAPPTALNLPVPYAVVSRRAGDNLRRGHVWVYSTEIEELKLSKDLAPALIPVVDSRGILLGTALYSSASQIALRLISRELVDHAQWLTVVAERLRTAIARRTSLLTADTNACRLVFSEADNLPGIIVDKYADIVVLQLLNKGLDSEEIRAICTETLRQELASPQLTIWERPDPRIRELEGLSAPANTPLYSATPGAPVSSTLFRLNGLNFHFDVNSGQKTGAFLDQRENYAAAARWAAAKGATGKALDMCTYQGGFALHLAQVCTEVTGVDASRASLEVAERNLAENQAIVTAAVDWVEGDAFEILRAWAEPKSGSEADRVWDLIVLDPPAFAKTKRAVEGALRGYKELNLRALRMLRAGGLLITCSCSQHVTWSDLESVVADAAVDAHRRVTLLERRGAAQDHPVLLNLPESEYLKCLICQID